MVLLPEALNSRCRTFLSRAAELRAHRSAETIHDLRVALRRFLAVLTIAGATLPDGGLDRARRTLRRFLKELNSVRDLEIQRGALRLLARRFPVLLPLVREIRAAERLAVREAMVKLLEIDIMDVERGLVTATVRLKSLGEHAAALRAIDSALHAGRATAYLAVLALREAIGRNDERSFHRVRVALKKYRYATEVLSPVLPEVRRRHFKSLGLIQKSLGDLQDFSLVAGVIRRYGRRVARRRGVSMLPVMEYLAARRMRLITEALRVLPSIDILWPE